MILRCVCVRFDIIQFLAGMTMFRISCGFFWLALITLLWIICGFLHFFVAVFDEAMGFVDRKLNALFDDIC